MSSPRSPRPRRSAPRTLTTFTTLTTLTTPNPRPRARRRRAFTLIELMIVVAIMAILAAVVAPMVISRVQREASTGRPATRITQAPPALAAFAGDRELAPPRTLSSDVRVHLGYGPVLVEEEVRSRYVATFRGTFELESADPDADALALHFPFPPDMAEARGVSLRLRGADGALVEPRGVEYGLDGIRWRGPVAPGQVITAEVAYEVIGQDTFSYAVASAGRTGKVRVRIDAEGPGEPVVPATSLAPTAIDPGHLEWQLSELVANRPIVVELPPGSSPLGRLVSLLRYAALAVLGFGAGFWYLSERYSPGRMDSFRFPHFFLLALTYSVFFASLGVILQWQPTAVALAAAALLSLPLLAVHVARLIDLGFALGSALPLAAYTLGSVTAAVFLDAHRPLVLLISGVVGLGYVTLTYPAWDAGRRAHRAKQAADLERTKAAAEVERARIASEAERAQVLAEAERRAAAERARTTEPSAHCLACGVRVDPCTRYCGTCGAERPRVIPCGGCGRELRVPPQVLRRRWSAAELHCEGCGARLALPAPPAPRATASP